MSADEKQLFKSAEQHPRFQKNQICLESLETNSISTACWICADTANAPGLNLSGDCSILLHRFPF